MTFARPEYLVETDWLEAHLNDPDLRILDCTVFFAIDANGVRLDSGRGAWMEGLIPGSGFADLMQDLSDRNSPLPFMMPPATQFADAMSRYGVGDGTRVVLNALQPDRSRLLESPVRAFEPREILATDGGGAWPVSWSPDGRTVLYVTNGPATSNDVWAAPMDGRTSP